MGTENKYTLDPLLQKVERLPDDLIRYIHSYIDTETKIKMICCEVFPTEKSAEINMMQLRLNLLNFYELNHVYKLPIQGKMIPILDILLEIRYCDLSRFYSYFKNVCNAKTVFPQSTYHKMVKGDGMISHIVHPFAHVLLFGDKTTCKLFHSRYISDIIHHENMKMHFSSKDIITFQDRYTISETKINRSLYFSNHFARIKEIMFLLLIFIRNFQNMKIFDPIIDSTLRNHLYEFLRDFLNSELVYKALIRMRHRQCMKDIRFHTYLHN